MKKIIAILLCLVLAGNLILFGLQEISVFTFWIGIGVIFIISQVYFKTALKRKNIRSEYSDNQTKER